MNKVSNLDEEEEKEEDEEEEGVEFWKFTSNSTKNTFDNFYFL